MPTMDDHPHHDLGTDTPLGRTLGDVFEASQILVALALAGCACSHDTEPFHCDEECDDWCLPCRANRLVSPPKGRR